MNLKSLYHEIEKQNLYIEQIVIQCIKLIDYHKTHSSQNSIVFEHNLTMLSNLLLNKTHIIKRKLALGATLMDTLNISDFNLNNRIKSSISSTVLTDLKSIKFNNFTCERLFYENIKQLELILLDFRK
ncbi:MULTISPECIES: hypothetical protein [Bacillus cereus group]|uniref:Uncharacterized protein n=1 Tax=Bacillus thuringiensis TaxID=1428 RepID=A0A9X6TGF4_BACTU|nr:MULTISPECIES: hypothetical protein [Bacillus cereus group]PEA85635.1 hypothetical protein CON71_34640 [Bacillus thuringiensis]PFV87619.1 hypothetical protein COL21_28495 [Bacillus thuringiensis]PGQ46071.1 hypothetical protein COA20_23070 [Bacillus thuringiensis]PGR86666.1 hypothetical protein COC68_31920 [Bacillus thuringiensis]PGV69775.1 hypothetical protein COD84_28305 [Bacillus cereus]